MDFIRTLLGTITDNSQPTATRVTAAVAIIALALIVAFTWPVLLLGGLLFGDHLAGAAEQRRLEQAQQAEATQNQWFEVAIKGVIPAIAEVLSVTLEPEELYFAGPYQYGAGFYYATPAVLDEEQRRRVMRTLSRKLAGYWGLSRPDFHRLYTVHADERCVFIGRKAEPPMRE